LFSSSIPSDLHFLLQHDSVFRDAGVELPTFSDSRDKNEFVSLIRTIVGQQLSTKAANTIWQRVVDGVGDVTPTGFSKIDDDVLRGFGLSRQKISYIRGLCDAVVSGNFNPPDLQKMSDEDAIGAITSLKGFGVWSAQMVLIFTLGRPDIWPAGDLGIREGVKVYYRLDERPDVSTTDSLGDKFKGRRSAAALLIWQLKDKK